jgi:5-methylcytosine-specific restriction endonuclease McrA
MKKGSQMEKLHSIRSGQKFERLTVISYTDRPNKKGEYKCVCNCGKIVYVRTWALKTGKSKSCGCKMKEDVSKRFLLPNNLGVINDLYRNYKKSADKRNYEFKISLEEFQILIESECYYCKEQNSLSPYGHSKKSNYRYNGIDRIDNNIGYTLDNSVPCCKICNNSKSTLNIEEFKNWIIKVYNNYVKN